MTQFRLVCFSRWCSSAVAVDRKPTRQSSRPDETPPAVRLPYLLFRLDEANAGPRPSWRYARCYTRELTLALVRQRTQF
ncbi:MAG: hypothetical protein R3C28_19170 [Pirellulaceae bacterium]